MIKLNNKGFALVETLIVSVFVMGIFTVLYTNFYPMIGEYEKRESYDDIDSLYKTHLLKKLVENDLNATGKTQLTNLKNGTINSFNFKCTYFNNANYCNKLLNKVKLNQAIVTKYNLTSLKNNITSISDENLQEYITYLPKYNNNKYELNYRIIAVYETEINKESEKNKKTVYKYSTIGVGINE